MKPARAHEGNQGFTAIEVLVALSVLAVVIMAVISTLGTASSLRVQDRALMRANSVLEDHLEQFRGMDPAVIINNIQLGTPTPPSATLVGGNLTAVYPTGTWANDPETGLLLLPGATLRVEVLSEASVGLLIAPSAAPDFDGNGNPASSVFASYEGVAPVRLTLTWNAGRTPAGAVQTRTQSIWTIFYRRA